MTLYSGSEYVVGALNLGWAKAWRAKGWVKPDKQPAKNPDLWARLLDLLETHEVSANWVRGHADNEKNERCDKLAVQARERFA